MTGPVKAGRWESMRGGGQTRAVVMATAAADLERIEEGLSALEAQAELGFTELSAALRPHIASIRDQLDTARRHVAQLRGAAPGDWPTRVVEAARALGVARVSLDEVLSRFRTCVAGPNAGRRFAAR